MQNVIKLKGYLYLNFLPSRPMAAPHYSAIAPSVPPNTSVDLKANGEVSRMRSHKGNMPSLPQTKYCPLCPAKFTRTTHLNRHLRSHTNERLHRCNICQSQFTRSDLLTRHKRTCGDSLNNNRSRRKSCQACAESKIKCSLTYPCTKCTSRGRDCVFVNDPETSRNKKYAASQKSSQRSLDASGVTVSTEGTHTPPISSSPQMLDPNFSSSSGSSSASSSHSSPRSEYFDMQQSIAGAFDLDGDTLVLDTHLSKLFTGNMFDPFMEQSLSPSSPQSALSGVTDDFSWLGSTDYYCTFSGEEVFNFSHADQQHLVSPIDFPTTATPNSSPVTLTHSKLPAVNSVLAGLAVEASVSPAAAELQNYVYLFFSAFSTQVPLLHAYTWQMDGTPPVLVRAMQACGALFVRTGAALDFITETLLSTRDLLIQEFAKNPTESTEQLHLILACVLLQTIGLFHQRADQRMSSNVYHGMLVMMVRRSGLLKRIGSWTAPDLTDPSSRELAWRDWSKYETVKRALLLSYLHDCCHCMYFSLCPSFQTCEFNINLPADDALWRASTSSEWFEILQAPSPYGHQQSRLAGVGMQHVLTSIASRSSTPPVLNPFASFIIIHSILRSIYECRIDNRSSEAFSRSLSSSEEEICRKDKDLTTQYALQGWLQAWLGGPESMKVGPGMEEPPFVCNALPFYWLAQVSLLAIREGTPVLGVNLKTPDGRPDGRFRLMMQWLDHIRSFLRRGEQMPVHLWEELMNIRARISEAEGDIDGNPNRQEGLLAFFPEQ